MLNNNIKILLVSFVHILSCKTFWTPSNALRIVWTSNPRHTMVGCTFGQNKGKKLDVNKNIWPPPFTLSSFWIRNWSHIASRLIVVILVGWGYDLQKSLRLRRLKMDPDEIWQDCSASKYASINEVGVSTWLSRRQPWSHFTQKSVALWWVYTQHPPGLLHPPAAC